MDDPEASEGRAHDRSRHYLLVGGAGGIGQACARNLVQGGHRVTIVDQDAESLERLSASGLAEECRFVCADALDPGEVDHLLSRVSASGDIDGLVYLVSSAEFGPVEHLEVAAFDRMLSVNVTMQLVWARAFASGRKGRRGSVVLIGSIYGVGSSAGRVAYGSVRGALMQLVRGLAVEWAPIGIRVNAIAPGWTDTPALRAAFPDTTPFERRSPFGRLGTPDDMAGPVRFLLSDESRWVTGVTLLVDGGVTAFLGTGDPQAPWPGWTLK